MRRTLLHAGVAVVVTRLVLASLVAAQIAEDEPPPTPVRPRLEIGPTAGVTVAFHEVGVMASVQTGQRSAIEVITSYMPPLWGAPPRSLVQLQARAPLRDHLLSRKSLIVGVTRIATGGDRRKRFLGGDDGDAMFVRPHAGVSLQWPAGSRVDVRLDLQGIFTFASEVPLVPRAMTALVWHPGRRR
jgi:hypothetical protein